MTRLVIADDDVKVRSAIELILEQEQACWQVVSVARDLPELLKIVNGEKPDLVLLDWELSVGESKLFCELSDGIQQLKNGSPTTKLLVLSCKPQIRQDVLNAGADAFVSKIDPPEVFLKTISELCKTLEPPIYPLVLGQFSFFRLGTHLLEKTA